VLEVPRDGPNRPDSVVLYTDGFRSIDGHEVNGLGDLKPVNEEFSERLAFAISGLNAA
jgi:hypothetical protein